MLVNWTVSDFKPIAGKLELSLSPITIIVGANSSGKSSIIQSILLIKQTLQYATTARALALNGPLLKLGDFEDVNNSDSPTKSFSIGWQYDADQFRQLLTFSIHGAQREHSNYLGRFAPKHVTFNVRFGLDPAIANDPLALLQPVVLDCQLRAVPQKADENEGWLNVTLKEGLSRDPELDPPTIIAADINPSSIRYQVNGIDESSRSSALEHHPEGNIIGVALRHFFPAYIAVQFDRARQLASNLADVICSGTRSRRAEDFREFPLPPSIPSIIDEWIFANAQLLERRSLFEPDNIPAKLTVGTIVDALVALNRQFRATPTQASFPSMSEVQPKIVDTLLEFFPKDIATELEVARPLMEAGANMRRFFEASVRYLGPLRDEPRAIYPLEALGNLTDVGFRGEHTAAVLHLNQGREVAYIRPITLMGWKSGTPIDATRQRSSLQAAVVDWLSYMGVANAITASDMGKFGHQLQVRTPGVEKMMDLTNVGVGVSQVLPIVVMALLAPVGSLLIFEQPELHLNPKVQARLADFFISVLLTQKQCLIETHSEYLLHRVRLRIAQAPDDQLAKLTKLYFVERNDGQSSCRAVDITRYGAIADWPADFFDQAQEEGEHIIAAASEKRRAEQRMK